jgi:putative endopeptidase
MPERPEIKTQDKEPRLKSTQVQLSLTRRPGNGFYQFVNHEWMKKTRIPSYFSEYGASEQIDNENNRKIIHLVNELGSIEPKVGEIPANQKDHLRFFAHIWKHKTAKKEEEYLKVLLSDLLNPEPSNLVGYMGWLIKSGVRTVLNLGTNTEERAPYYLRNTLTLGSISLPIKYYNDKTSSIWAAYIKYIDTCSVELGLPYLHHAIQGETELASIIRMDTNDDLVIEKHGSNLINFQSDFAWSSLMASAEITWRNRLWLIPDPLCVKRIIKWFIRTSLQRPEVVAAVLTLHLLNSVSNHLRPSIKTAAFSLFKKELSGTKEPPSEKLQYIYTLSETYPDVLCSEFSKIDSNEAKLKDLYSLIDNIKASAIELVQGSKIIHNKTRSLTVEKIHRMKVDIGSNNNCYSPQAPYFPDSLIHTILSINQARYHYLMSKVGRRPNKKDIIYPCFIVNASYYEDYNFMMIPWGILHDPFYSDPKDAPLGWNYGGIGATLGHELCHAFDTDGIEYNPRAQHKRWWTQRERSNYKARTRKLRKFFSKFKHYGLQLDGEKTLAENWADFGGLHVSLNALKAEIDRLGLDEVKRKEAIRTFFISYASSWKDIIRKKKAIHMIQKSVHSLPEDRVDRIVPHFEDWVKAFDIKETDALFIEPKDRLKFF